MAQYALYVGKGHQKLIALFEKLKDEGNLSKFIVDLVEKNMQECFEDRLKIAKEEFEFWNSLISEQNNIVSKQKVKEEHLINAKKYLSYALWKFKKMTDKELIIAKQSLENNKNLDGAKAQIKIIDEILEREDNVK